MGRFFIVLGLVALASLTVSDAYAMGDVVRAAASVPVVAPIALAALTAVQMPRSILSMPRAEGDPAKVLANLTKAFEDFKAENETKLNAKADVVTDEKVERINTAVTELQASLDSMATRLASAELGGGGSEGPVSAEVRAYRGHFASYFRQGDGEREVKAYNVKAAARTGSNPDGGYLVSDEIETTIGRVLGKVSAMRQLASVRTIGGGSYKKMHGVGGATSGWVGETGGRPETATPKLAELSFPTMELYAMPAATQTLLDDAVVDIGAWLGDEVSLTFAEQEGAAFILGDGVSRPRGLLTVPTVADANWGWGKVGFVASGAAAGFDGDAPADALIDLVQAVRGGYRQNAGFLMNRKTVATIRKFKDGQGNYLWQPSIQVGDPSTVLGYGITDDDNMPDVGAGAFPIAFGDFRRGYLIVDRAGVRVLRDPYTAKPYVLFYTTKRVGGGVQDYEAIKLFKISA
ncbi:phage major capsid protein [Enterovirga rhinocerotis]|uniref:HK97 family phage major capsid protein n=1 Tax=Enterovirga rhinocerotis TaxID=1339210 RepID=A0A4R7C728_9HYPH|nr:phage major capsid protein [Enterovirga rhinocerotis]TDR94198.1 HK97 family phage major capsid protein [Enterovirga rhinocerotis]